MLTIKPTKKQFKLALLTLGVLSVSGLSYARSAPVPAAPQPTPAMPQQPALPAEPDHGLRPYVGVNLGGGWQSNTGAQPVPGIDSAGFPDAAITSLGQVAPADNTTTFGGQVRVGIELDAPFTSFGETSMGAEILGLFPTNKNTHDQVITNDGLTLLSSDNANITEIGAIRGTISLNTVPGVSVGLVGGPAVNCGKFSSVQTFSAAGEVLHTNTTTVNDCTWGGTFGGSVGYNVNDNWQVLVGYDHYWFGRRDGDSGAFTPGGSLVPGTNITTSFKPQFGFASVGLMYRFGGHSAPMAAGVYK